MSDKKEHKKMGRPIVGKPKTTRLGIRVDEETNRKLDEYSLKLNTTKTELVRKGIDIVIESIENNNK
ncbi:MAG: ribbon-helix-helix domain-containing protein [Peptoniphilaceae bacterium]|nr:ribbon-helix-helix domain-containing protein [Peptoniphilaceae bacterium]MDD7383800.1 ribbon-helix-helix domain-containing protein [Peptoniphilaceae bacterium]MDY3737802.1 ribbon-helix-helix domain-containing protein [Peptoniphilaceae bacterium]